jgi:adenine-specific DNA-methyltransferase
MSILLDQIPKIFEQSKKTAEKILKSIEQGEKISLQTREIISPSKDNLIKDLFSNNNLNISKNPNRLIYGANFSESLRGKIDLIYIDPPFDSKADYRTKIILPNVKLEQKPTVIEQYAYGDTWRNGTSSYLEMLTPRLILMKELLSEQGSIYVHLDWHVLH